MKAGFLTVRPSSLRQSAPALSLAAAALAAALALPITPAHAQAVQGTVTKFQYDFLGNLTAIVDPLQRTTKHFYDPLNRRTSSLDPANGVTRFGFDGLDELVQVVDPRNLATNYQVDGLGNQTLQLSPDTGNTARTFDENGNILTSTDAKGQTTRFSWDVLNRVTTIVYADGATVNHVYDQGPNAIGRLSRITDAACDIEFSYDQQGRVVAERRTIDGIAWLTTYSFDQAGHLAAIGYPSGRTVALARDAMGRVNQIDTTMDGETVTLVRNVQYQPFGGVLSFQNGAGQTLTRSYDLDGRITAWGTPERQRSLTYDPASRIVAQTDTGSASAGITYGYDNLDRLTMAQRGASSLGFGYDPVGNRTSSGSGAALSSYSYGQGSNRLLNISGGQARTFETDANGSITANGLAQFSYDARGRMVAANTVLGPVLYRINALGQRVAKTTSEGTTVFHYDHGGRLIAESLGDVVTEYVWLDDMPVAVLAQ